MNLSTKHFAVFALILAASFSRLLPHPPNVTPIAAMCLFGGSILAYRFHAILITFFSLFISDFIINNTVFRAFYPDVNGLVFWADYMYWTYGAFLVIVLMGGLLQSKWTLKKIVTVSMLSSVLFFLITNFGIWSQGIMYPRTWTGLMSCFGAALPFFRNTFFGNLFFTLVIFKGFEWMSMRYRKPVKSYQKA